MNQVKKELKVKCPKCKKEFSYYTSEFRPFCSERCKMVDLGHWLEETYNIIEELPSSGELVEGSGDEQAEFQKGYQEKYQNEGQEEGD